MGEYYRYHCEAGHCEMEILERAIIVGGEVSDGILLCAAHDGTLWTRVILCCTLQTAQYRIQTSCTFMQYMPLVSSQGFTDKEHEYLRKHFGVARPPRAGHKTKRQIRYQYLIDRFWEDAGGAPKALAPAPLAAGGAARPHELCI